MMEGSKRLRVYLLGGFEMYYNETQLQLKKKQTAKPVQLLQLLLYHKEEGLPRHTLLETLYGQETEIDAANNLNSTVSQLRKLLRDTCLPDENYVRVKMNRYFFSSSFPVWVDTEEVANLRQSADLMSGADKVNVLYRLCDLYRGRFLPELDGESWVEIARADYQRVYRDSLNEVCRALKNRGAYDEILRLSGLAAKMFPFDEWQVWQQECLLVQGRVREARELYSQVERLYLTELDAPPPERMRAQCRRPEREFWRKAQTPGEVQRWLASEEDNSRFCIPLLNFLDTYRIAKRICTASGAPFFTLLCTLSGADGRADLRARGEFQNVMERLGQAIQASLQAGDAFTRYSDSQFLAFLIGTPQKGPDAVSDEISRRFRSLCARTGQHLDIQVLTAGGSCAADPRQ